MRLLPVLSIFLFVLVTSGCVTNNPATAGLDRVQAADRTNASQEYFDRMVVADPGNATAWCIRGMYYNNAFSQYETALESYNRGLELDSRNGICWYGKGTTLRNMKQFNESAISFENAKKIDPTLV
ncbi:MAG: hypothetical protein WC593_06670 [Methanoregula sp.]